MGYNYRTSPKYREIIVCLKFKFTQTPAGAYLQSVPKETRVLAMGKLKKKSVCESQGADHPK